MSSENNPCFNCNLRKIAKIGCCTTNVGYGLKNVEIKGRKISVCNNLQQNLDTLRPYCGIYDQRPQDCKSFECDDLLETRADYLPNGPIWNI